MMLSIRLLQHAVRFSLPPMLVCAAIFSPPAFALDCTEKYRPVLDRSLGNGDIAALSGFLNNKTIAEECPESWHDSIRLKATQVVANEAERRVFEGDVEGAEQLLLGNEEAQFALSAFWSVNAVLGDIARKRTQWQLAAQQYGEAYELAAEDVALIASGQVRSESIQLELFRLASESLRLSEDLSVAISRSGSGSGTLSSRGFKPVAIPLPVTFEFNSDQLGPEGVQQASLIANYISSQNLQQVTLTGHTDWKGCSTYNQQLSERRAAALADAVDAVLKQKSNVAVTINTQGLGESCPPVLSASGDYSEPQRDDLARRVEISLSGELPTIGENVCDLQLVKSDAPSC